MSIPNAALQKLLQEVETQAIQSQQKIKQAQAEINLKRRDARLNDLTVKELGQVSEPSKVYEGVGKMFVATPLSTINQRLSNESAGLKKDIADLEKRLHYLETTFKNSREHIERILQTGQR